MSRQTAAGLVLGLISLLNIRCGPAPTAPKTTGGGTTTVTLPLAVTCPASLTLSTPLASLSVAYAPAVTTGGVLPTTASCSPASQSAFPKGATTPVLCTATDSAGQTATCTFAVKVDAVPVLKGTTFLAFGDSFTEGEVLSALRVTVVDRNRSYPMDLQHLLDARYTAQIPIVDNRGLSGHIVLDHDPLTGAVIRNADERERYTSALAELRPDAVLLLEGVNDLNQGQSTTDIANVLATMVREAYAAGAKAVYLATQPPEIPGKSNSGQAEQLPDFNNKIRAAAAREGATLVDLYAAMIGDAANLINPEDGLHPYPAGYVVMAQTFFAAIKSNFEQSSIAAVQKRIH